MGTFNCACLKSAHSEGGTLSKDKYEILSNKNETPLKNSINIVIDETNSMIPNNIKSYYYKNNNEAVTIRSIQSYDRKDFDERLKPGVEMAPGQVPGILSEKALEIENKLGKFQLNDSEKGFILNPDLRKYTILYSDNKIYDSQYNKKWEKEGYGSLYFPDGSKFEGIFKEDRMVRGRLINSEGDYYEGTFSNDLINGFGRYISVEGVIYNGEWKDDIQDGQGEEIYPDGSKYNGTYIQGSKQGKGIFTWPDGTIYEGDFTGNKIEGYGKVKYLDGRIYEGEWKDNKMDGKGIFTWPDKKKYIGEYKNDKKWGSGVFIYSNNKIYEGFWYDGKQDGLGVLRSKNSIQIGEWKCGKKMRILSLEEIPDLEQFVKDIRNKVPSFKDNLDNYADISKYHNNKHTEEDMEPQLVSI